MLQVNIRQEAAADYDKVERITREAFYNIYVPGCTEHYLIRLLRRHEDFLPELDLVLELDGEIIGSIMYTKAKLVDEQGAEKQIVTFGPLCIAPSWQRKGYGKLLLNYSLEQAGKMGYEAVVIFGSPANYVSSGFVSCRKYNVSTADGKYPAAMLVKELKAGALSGKRCIYYCSPAMEFDAAAALRYDDTLEPLARKQLPCQEEFYILSHSFIED